MNGPAMCDVDANRIYGEAFARTLSGEVQCFDPDRFAAHAVAQAQHARDVEAVRGVTLEAMRAAGMQDDASHEAVRRLFLDALEGRRQ